jgi:hypothetical protein
MKETVSTVDIPMLLRDPRRRHDPNLGLLAADEIEKAYKRIGELERALRFIADQERLTFAECSVAEAIMTRAKIALAGRWQ